MLTFQIELTNNNSNNNNNNNNSNDCHNIFFQMRFFLKTNYRLRFTNLLNIFQQFDDENALRNNLYIPNIVSDYTMFSNFSIFILFTKLKARCPKSSCFTFVYTQLSFTLMDFKLANGS